MTGSTKKLPIPKDMKEKPFWTVSGANKIPLRIVSALFNNQDDYYSPAKDKALATYDIAESAKKFKPDLLMAYQLQKTDGFIVVDIEPDGLKDNPYKGLPFIYLEHSRHNGLHGILPFYPTDKELLDRVVIKDNNHKTEFLMSNHFVTFTEDILELDQIKARFNYAYSDQFQKELTEILLSLKPKVEEVKAIVTDFSKELSKNLTAKDHEFINSLNVTFPELTLNDDASVIEAKFIAHVSYLVFKNYRLTKDDYKTKFLPIVYEVLEKNMPYRKKHNQVFDYADVGKMSHRQRDILKMTSYVWNQKFKNY